MVKVINNTSRMIVDAGTQTWAHLASQYAFANKSLNDTYETHLKTREHYAHLLLGTLGHLAESVLKNAQLHKVDANEVFKGLVQENERGFNNTFKVTVQDKSNGRAALAELADFLNGRSTTSKITNKYTMVTGGRTLKDLINDLVKDPALIDKTRGAVFLLSESFKRETKEAYPKLDPYQLENERADLLTTITANTVVYSQVLFEELAVDTEAHFTNNNTRMYSNIVALALITANAQAYQATLTDNKVPSRFEVPVSQSNLAESLANIINLYRANTYEYSFEDVRNYIERELNKADSSSKPRLNYASAHEGLKIMDAHVQSGQHEPGDVEKLLNLALILFAYSPTENGDGDTVFNTSANPVGDILRRVGHTVLTLPLPELDKALEANTAPAEGTSEQ